MQTAQVHIPSGIPLQEKEVKNVYLNKMFPTLDPKIRYFLNQGEK